MSTITRLDNALVAGIAGGALMATASVVPAHLYLNRDATPNATVKFAPSLIVGGAGAAVLGGIVALGATALPTGVAAEALRGAGGSLGVVGVGIAAFGAFGLMATNGKG